VRGDGGLNATSKEQGNKRGFAERIAHGASSEVDGRRSRPLHAAGHLAGEASAKKSLGEARIRDPREERFEAPFSAGGGISAQAHANSRPPMPSAR
jgi:hypothetical protein